MITNHKPTGRAMSMSGGLASGGITSLGFTLLYVFVLAKALDMQVIAWEKIGYYIMVMLVLSSALGAIVSVSRIKRQRLMVSFLSGIIYFAILMSITALFFGGQYEAVGITALLILAGAVCVGLLGIRKNRGGKRKIAVKRHR